MTDVLTREQRSRNMAAIKAKDTRPEMRVRSLLHSLGYRFRLHRKDLPGTPDIVLAKYHTVIFVHGCFWHCHVCKYGSVTPATRAGFWATKRKENVERDVKAKQSLEERGWRVITVWECETKSREALCTALSELITDSGCSAAQ